MRDKESHTILLFARHGAPDYPEDRLYAREDDPGLTAYGQQQAEALGRWAATQSIDALVASPTRRTRETVAPAATALGLDPAWDARLEERGFGVWEGLDFDAIRESHGEDFRRWKEDPIGFAPEGAENMERMSERVDAGVQQVLKQHPGETVMVVAHVGTIRVALCAALKTPLSEYRRFHIATGSVTRIEYGARQSNLALLGMVPDAEGNGATEWRGGQL